MLSFGFWKKSCKINKNSDKNDSPERKTPENKFYTHLCATAKRGCGSAPLPGTDRTSDVPAATAGAYPPPKRRFASTDAEQLTKPTHRVPGLQAERRRGRINRSPANRDYGRRTRSSLLCPGIGQHNDRQHDGQENMVKNPDRPYTPSSSSTAVTNRQSRPTNNRRRPM